MERSILVSISARNDLPASSPPTYIAATDTGVLDIDEHIVRVLQLRNGTVFEFDLVDAFQDKGKVLSRHVSTSTSNTLWNE